MMLTQEAVEAEVRRLMGSEFAGDLYRQAAANVLGVEAEAVTPDQRAEVKRRAFGSFYG